MKENPLVVDYRQVSTLKPCNRNSRKHSKHQIRQIAQSIEFFGFTNPILVDSEGMIVAGHGRVEAAKLLRIGSVPTICLDQLSPDQIRAYMIADNKLAENAGWDRNILAIEFQHLLSLGLDLELTGFCLPEIDLLIQDPGSAVEGVIPAPGNQVSARGDIWQLRNHRLLCGSALERDCFQALMKDQKADLVFIDPPYNVPIDGNAANIAGKSSTTYREFVMATGEMSDDQFHQFLSTALGHLQEFSRSGSVHFVCMDWRHLLLLLDVGKGTYDALLNVCVWVKNTGGMGSFYRSRHEFVSVFRNGKSRYRNNIQLGRYGRNRTNVWEYPNLNTLSRIGDEGDLLALHPTVKPTALVADALLDCSARGDIVLDSFLGSGTTIIAAERTGRVCYGVEIDPAYVDTAIRRWQKCSGEQAVHELSGRTFDEVELELATNGQ
jgi:DNA modification methylase